MRVTDDKYELPIAVADSQIELARMLGVTEGAVSHGLKDISKTGKKTYLKILMEESYESD